MAMHDSSFIHNDQMPHTRRSVLMTVGLLLHRSTADCRRCGRTSHIDMLRILSAVRNALFHWLAYYDNQLIAVAAYCFTDHTI